MKNLVLEIEEQLKKRVVGQRGKQQCEEKSNRAKRRTSMRRGKQQQQRKEDNDNVT